MNYQRIHFKNLDIRLRGKRRFIQVVMGPRQVGKTTLIHQVLGRLNIAHHYAAADAIANSDAAWLGQQWESARLQVQQGRLREFLLVIDEIQKISNWSEVVKALWDEDSRNKCPIKVVLLGSSRLLLQQGLTESLAGRFETTYLGHWSCDEMNGAFGWTPEQYAWFGGYPGSAALIKDENRWKSYVKDALIETSISRDILMLSRVDKPALMRRLFELGCLYSGQVLSYNKILGQLQDAGNTTTLSHYLGLMNTAGLLTGIEKYSAGRLRQRSSSPKFLVHNTALISAQHADNFNIIQKKPEQWGRIVESSVGAHLLNHSLTEGYGLFYWRHRSDEIDYVMEKNSIAVGIEVKSGTGGKASGMQAFQHICKPKRMFLIGKTGISWQDFLRMNPSKLL